VRDKSAALALEIQAARRIVFFTGAGLSTESGIPDFRSPGGVWSKMQPIQFQDFVASDHWRREAWNRVFSGKAGWVGARPNSGHETVTRLVQSRPGSSVVTQNVDNLHQDAGLEPEQIIELHGNASYAKCLDCGTRHELEDLRQPFEDEGIIPSCRMCSGLVKTATISFGQSMPEDQMARAEAATRACDLFVVLGSSLVVYPAAGFPIMAKRLGARLVIINREPTDMDDIADLVIHHGIGDTFARAGL
jgi:NAD-dependent deacetylase